MKSWEGYQRGVNLGGWLSQCSHTKERYESFITEADFAELSGWGIDHVRVPVDYNLVEDDKGEYREEGFAYIQRAIDWCGKYGLHMILDLHKTYGFSFDDGEKEEGFFESGACQERFYRLWEQFASRYGRCSSRVAFELLNEVTDPGYCQAWNRIADTCIGRIRAIAPESRILVGGYWNNSAHAVKDIRLSDYTNVVLNFHCYDPMLFTHQGAGWVREMPRDFRCAYPATYGEYAAAMKEHLPHAGRGFGEGKAADELLGQSYFEELFAGALEEAERRDVPLYCGEYGVIDLADGESTVKWYEDIHAVFVRHGIGRAAWSYRQMNFGLVDPGREKLLEVLRRNL